MSRMAEALAPSTYQTPPRSPLLMPEDVPPEVCVLFEQLALRVAAAGHKRFSSDAILHRIRWEHQVERGNRDFKCNDHWTAPLARWFLARHPEMAGFFSLRKLKEERNG